MLPDDLEQFAMLTRTLEPEVMESAEEAHDYDSMDHSAVNEAFVNDFLAVLSGSGFEKRLHDAARPLTILDSGTGTARIPIALVKRGVTVRVTAIDLPQEMLKLAQRNLTESGAGSSIALDRADGKELPFGDATFDAVMSNSIVHHIPEPTPVLREMVRVVRPGGVLFIRDLVRPESAEEADALVAQHAVGESQRQQQLLRESLHAALTLDEVRHSLHEVGLSPEMVAQTSDRHWTIVGVR